MGNRTLPWAVVIEEGGHMEQYLVWANSEHSAVRKAMIQFRREFRDDFDLRVAHGKMTILVRRLHKQEVGRWEGTLIAR